MGIKNGWSIITATQTNRSQFDSADISASQVSESSALGATVDAMFGIIATPLMQAQGVYELKCIYDRVSPQANKKKKFNCNFNFLRIMEDPNEKIVDMSYANPTPPSNGAYRAAPKQQFAPGEPPAEAVTPPVIDNLNTNMPKNAITSTPLFDNKLNGLF